MECFNKGGTGPQYTPQNYKVWDKEKRIYRPLNIAPEHQKAGFLESVLTYKTGDKSLNILYWMNTNRRHHPASLGLELTSHGKTFIKWMDESDTYIFAESLNPSSIFWQWAKQANRNYVTIKPGLRIKAVNDCLRLEMGRTFIDAPKSLMEPKSDFFKSIYVEMWEIMEAWEQAHDNHNEQLRRDRAKYRAQQKRALEV